MKINATIKPTSLTEEEAVNIKGGINSQSVAIASSCTDCNCWFSNENKKENTVKQPIHMNNGKNGVDCYSKNGHAVTVLTRQS